MIQIEALTTDLNSNSLASIRIHVDIEDVAKLPKMVRLSAQGWAYIQFRTNGVNGGVNETGAKRVRSLLKAADKNGIGIVFAQPAYTLDELNAPTWDLGMGYATRGEVEALIG